MIKTDPPDDWDEDTPITAVETPNSLAAQPGPKRRSSDSHRAACGACIQEAVTGNLFGGHTCSTEH